LPIGQRLAELRKSKGLTQSKLAGLAKLSASTIAMYETNRRSPDDEALSKLAEVLEVPVDSILGKDTTNKIQTPESSTKAQTHVKGQAVEESSPPQPEHGVPNLTTLALSREEARFILFLRMNPDAKNFLESYVMANDQKRQQLERTWQLIHDFQS
jgi:transcriptional regulator with XRE-family HTH domain